LTEHNSDQQQQQSYDHLPSLGKELRDQREARNLSIEQVAVDLHIDRRFIKAIEQDNYAMIGKQVFIRGYVRNYARYLEIDQQLVMEMLEPFLELIDHRPQKPEFLDTDINAAEHLDYTKAQLSFSTRQQRQRSGILAFWTALLLFLLLVGGGGIIYVYFNQTEPGPSVVKVDTPPTIEPKHVESEPVQKPQPSPVLEGDSLSTSLPVDDTRGQENAETQTAADTTGLATSENVDKESNEPLADETASDETFATHEPGIAEQASGQSTGIAEQTSVEPQQSATQAQENALVNEGGDRLLFILDNNCWIEVRRPNGSVILSRLFQANEDPLLLVNLPVDVIVGNAAGATIWANGLNLNIDSYTHSNVARLRIPG